MLSAWKKSRLPSGYQEVEWLECDGTQYLIFNGASALPFAWDAKFAITRHDSGKTNNLFGSWIRNTNNNYDIRPIADLGRSYFQGAVGNTPWKSIATNIPPQAGSIYETSGIVDDRANVSGSVNGTAFSYGNAIPLLGAPVYAFGFPGVTDYGIGMFFLKLSYGGYNHDLVPCYQKIDQKPGMYDVVENVFYTNQGTGEFLVGPDVN